MNFIDSKILIIDDEPDICNQLCGLLNDIGYSCDKAYTSEKGLEIFKKKKFSLVLLDIWLNNSKFDGFQALEKVQSIDQNIPVIMISGHGNIETAVNSIKKGAYDFIEKPFDSELLVFKIKKAIENFILKKKIEEFSRKDLNSEIVAISKSSKLLEKKIKEVSKTDSNVFLIGDEGSGKEFVASKIHDNSHRAKKYFKSIDCRLDKNKFEELLFGSEDNQVIKELGLLDEVNSGTIYFKNITGLADKLQGKILRILDEKKYYRIGALNPNILDLRVIASSDRNSIDNLRKDLLKKLNFTIIEIPNLSNRKSDVGSLIEIFSSEIFTEKGLKSKKFSSEVISYLIDLNYFRNIFQLKKFVEWIIVMLSNVDDGEINLSEVINLGKNLVNKKNVFCDDSMHMNIKRAREDFEKKYLLFNLEKFKYNVTKMAKEIGMERTAIYRKLKFLNIKVDLEKWKL